MQRTLFAVLLGAAMVLSFGGSPVCAQEAALPAIVSALAGEIPSDAVILFDGHDLNQWQKRDGKPADWIVKDGDIIVLKSGPIVTKEHFGDMQIHLEFRCPAPAKGEGQGRGNSGVYIHGNYEVQVLDSYENPTYPDGQAAAIYKQHIPLVNASRPPGIWQTYDIIFHAARFDANGAITRNPRITILHNGVLVQDDVEVKGPSGGAMGNKEFPTGPIMLQDHGNPVRYRNIWVRRLN